MATQDERLTQCEQSILRLAANKLDTTDLASLLLGINTQIADLQTTVANLILRIETLEQYNAAQVASS